MLTFDQAPSLSPNLYSAQQVKVGELECAALLNIEMYQLMEKAGSAVFETILAYYPQAKKILIIAGGGNNGGDAFIVAALAMQSGLEVQVLVLDPEATWCGDALIALRNLQAKGGKLTDFDVDTDYQQTGFDLVVDGLLGIGAVGELRPPCVELINYINKLTIPVIAIDLPSGLHADTGTVSPVAIHAAHTVTFIVGKLGLFTAQGPDHCGHIVCAGLGVSDLFTTKYPPYATLANKPFVARLPKRKHNSHKGSYGHVVCFGGNRGMAGAIFLAAKAALRAGAGKVTVFTHHENVNVITNLCPELMVFSWQADDSETSLLLTEKIAGANSIIIGPGLGKNDWANDLYHAVIAELTVTDTATVIDADGLNLLAKQVAGGKSAFNALNTVLTPHPLEAARLLLVTRAQVNAQRKQYCEQLATDYHSMCVLKGAGSLVSNGEQTSVNRSGNPGMATAGMGDVLSGIIAALIVNNGQLQATMVEKVRLAVYLHGLAGDMAAKKGEIGLLATDVIEQIPAAIASTFDDG